MCTTRVSVCTGEPEQLEKKISFAQSIFFNVKLYYFKRKGQTSNFSFIQVKYGIKEYACTAVDMISRRTRLAFLNVQAAEEALPRIVELMGRELNWSESKKQVLYKSFATTIPLLNV